MYPTHADLQEGLTQFDLISFDTITGQWYTVDSATSVTGLLVAQSMCDGPWRIVKTEVVSQSDEQPIGS